MIRDDLKQNNISKLVEDLLDHLLARDTSEGLGCDNMTAILITLKWFNHVKISAKLIEINFSLI